MSQNIPTINRLGDCSQVVADYSFDVSGLFCPEPVMLLHKEIKNIKEGQILSIVATDPSTTRDVPKFCHFLGHQLIAADEIDGKFHYYIKKGFV